MNFARVAICMWAAAVGALAHGIAAQRAPQDAVTFPDAYRTWAHVKSVLVGPESALFETEAGIHHIYANEKALRGYRTGTFPDSSIIVYDLLETRVVEGNTIEGPQRRVDVMVKDRERYRATGGWGFGRFFGGNRKESVLSAESMTDCYACHSQRQESDGVFSQFRP